tara:strand:+ start:5243 stop:5452 length:210 start_codon:yes stop_codon:yes gene_type:complete
MNETITWEDLSELFEKHGVDYVLTEYLEEEDLEGIEDKKLRKSCLSVRESLIAMQTRITQLEERGWLDE